MPRHDRRPKSCAPAPVRQDAKDLRWHLLDTVKQCRDRLNLRDRDITVLRGLLSLMPRDATPAQMIVFASNRVLIDRCDGIDERTLRRRIAHLEGRGLLERKTSPNGKRYQIRGEGEDIRLTYGIDLSPMFRIQSHLEALAEDCRREAAHILVLKALIRDVLFHRPDAGTAELREEARRSLRRKLSPARLREIAESLRSDGDEERVEAEGVNPAPASDLTASHGQNDRHIHRSNKETLESERSEGSLPGESDNPISRPTQGAADITVGECMECARTASAFAPNRPRHWGEVIDLSAMLAPSIGLSKSCIQVAESTLGRHGFALAVLGMVEACERIRNPNAYLKALVRQAESRALDVVRMFRSLVNAPRSVACLPG